MAAKKKSATAKAAERQRTKLAAQLVVTLSKNLITRTEAETLASFLYGDKPAPTFTDREARACRKLASMGLLEREPSTRRPLYRQTAWGKALIDALYRKGWLNGGVRES